MRDLRENIIGIYEKAIPDSFEWSDKIEIAKQAGYDYIQMSIDESEARLNRLSWTKAERKAFCKLLEAKDFSVRSICLSGHRGRPFGSKDPILRAKARKLLDEAIQFALDIGVRNIQLAGYDVFYEEADEETRANFIEGMKYAADQASRFGIMMSIETMENDFSGSIAWCKAFLTEVNSPWLQVYPDLGNLTLCSPDPVEDLKNGIQSVAAIHLKETRPGEYKCVPFGQGHVNFPLLFATISELKYAGTFVVEMWADNDEETDFQEAVQNIHEALEWMRERMKEGQSRA